MQRESSQGQLKPFLSRFKTNSGQNCLFREDWAAELSEDKLHLIVVEEKKRGEEKRS